MRRPPLRRWARPLLVLGGGCAAIVLIVLAVRYFAPSSGRKALPPTKTTAETETAASPASPPTLLEEKFLIPKGTNLARLLRGQGFENKEIQQLKDAVKPAYDLARITAGHEMRLFRTPEGIWKTIEYDIDDARYLTVRNESDGIKAEVKPYPFEFRTALVCGVIETSPVAAMAKLGEDEVLAFDLAERCFGWDIDFYTDLRKGDTFKILVEKKYLDGKFAGYRNILAAEFVNAGKTFQAFRFTYPDSGVADYYDEDGLSKRKELLKSPFKYGARITSRFSSSRLHPIYKVYRPHYGVDYGAPLNTPVQATADGKVTFAGWKEGSGRMVRIQHKNSYETMYLHLGGFGPGVRAGAQIKGGDIVGYVGSSGDSTGPHLDYRINYHGTPVNPLGQKFKPADPVRKEFAEAYKNEAQRLRRTLDAPRILQAAILAVSF